MLSHADVWKSSHALHMGMSPASSGCSWPIRACLATRYRLCFFKNTGSKRLVNKRELLTVHGPTTKSRAKRRKMKSKKMLLSRNSTMIHCSLNSVSCLHCSVSRGGILYCSLNSGACEQCKNCTVNVKFFFFFSVC